jgi:hypothetical protein
VPALRLTGKSPARSKPAAAKRTPARKPAAAKQAPTRKPAAKAAAPASTNGAATRGPKLPEGWTKTDFNRVVKDMQKANAAKVAAADRLDEAQYAVNELALGMISEGIQMSVVSKELDLSRQWLYNLMENLYEKYGYDEPVRTQRQQAAKQPRGRSARASRTSKPAAKKPAARKAPAAKKAPTRKAPARKAPAAGRPRVRITR